MTPRRASRRPPIGRRFRDYLTASGAANEDVDALREFHGSVSKQHQAFLDEVVELAPERLQGKRETGPEPPASHDVQVAALAVRFSQPGYSRSAEAQTVSRVAKALMHDVDEDRWRDRITDVTPVTESDQIQREETQRVTKQYTHAWRNACRRVGKPRNQPLVEGISFHADTVAFFNKVHPGRHSESRIKQSYLHYLDTIASHEPTLGSLFSAMQAAGIKPPDRFGSLRTVIPRTPGFLASLGTARSNYQALEDLVAPDGSVRDARAFASLLQHYRRHAVELNAEAQAFDVKAFAAYRRNFEIWKASITANTFIPALIMGTMQHRNPLIQVEHRYLVEALHHMLSEADRIAPVLIDYFCLYGPLDSDVVPVRRSIESKVLAYITSEHVDEFVSDPEVVADSMSLDGTHVRMAYREMKYLSRDANGAVSRDWRAEYERDAQAQLQDVIAYRHLIRKQAVPLGLYRGMLEAGEQPRHFPLFWWQQQSSSVRRSMREEES